MILWTQTILAKSKKHGAKRALASFLETNSSTHSYHSELLKYIVEYCENNNINYTLQAYPKMGYVITKQKQVKL